MGDRNLPQSPPVIVSVWFSGSSCVCTFMMAAWVDEGWGQGLDWGLDWDSGRGWGCSRTHDSINVCMYIHIGMYMC